MGEDFLCDYDPQGGALIEPAPGTGFAVAWSKGAEDRLNRVPPFIRRFVRQRAEAYACELGEATVTARHLDTLAKKRFGSVGPPGVTRPPGIAGRDGTLLGGGQ